MDALPAGAASSYGHPEPAVASEVSSGLGRGGAVLAGRPAELLEAEEYGGLADGTSVRGRGFVLPFAAGSVRAALTGWPGDTRLRRPPPPPGAPPSRHPAGGRGFGTGSWRVPACSG